MRDLVRRGTEHPSVKLTEAQVVEIRERYLHGEKRISMTELGARYGVSHQTVRAIVHGETWKEVGGPIFRPDVDEGKAKEPLKVLPEEDEERITERAYVLADIVSEMLWSGDRRWERATREQFQHLKAEARRRMKK